MSFGPAQVSEAASCYTNHLRMSFLGWLPFHFNVLYDVSGHFDALPVFLVTLSFHMFWIKFHLAKMGDYSMLASTRQDIYEYPPLWLPW